MVSSMKEVHRLMRKIGKISDNQATISKIDWDGEVNMFTVTIRPNDGLYKGGTFDFEVSLGSEFPENPPWIWCTTDIYHPNIDNTEHKYDVDATNVCLNLLDSGIWCSSFGLEGIVLGLQFLMHHPNLEDPLSPHFDGSVELERFHDNVKKYMAGEELDEGMTFGTEFKVIDGVLVDTVCDNKDIETKDNSTNEETNTSDNSEVINCTNTNEKSDNVNEIDCETVEPVTDICKIPDIENETVEPVTDACKLPIETDETVEKTNDTIKNEVIETAAVKSDGDNDDDDDGNENAPFYLKCVEGDVVIVFGEIDDDDVDITTRNTKNFEKDTESLDVIDIASACGEIDIKSKMGSNGNPSTEAINSEQILGTCNTELTGSNSAFVASENVLNEPWSEPRSNEGSRTLKSRRTCGLWPLFRNVFLKLFQEFIAREGKNDVLL